MSARTALLGRILAEDAPERRTAAELRCMTSPDALLLPGFDPPPLDKPAAPSCPLFDILEPAGA